jgi:hypothetical protein
MSANSAGTMIANMPNVKTRHAPRALGAAAAFAVVSLIERWGVHSLSGQQVD